MRVKIKQEDLLNYIRQNLSYNQMAEKKGVSAVTIWKHMEKIDADLINQAKIEGEELRRIEKQKRILGYIRQNLSREEIAKKEEITEVTLWKYIKNEIDEELLKQAEQDAKEMEQIERQRKLLGYIRQKLTREEMAKQEGVTKVTIWNYMKEIDKELINRAKKEDENEWVKTEQELENKIQQLMSEREEKWQSLMEKYDERLKELKKETDENVPKKRKINEDLVNQAKKESKKLKNYKKKAKLRKINLLKQIEENGKGLEKIEKQKRILGYIIDSLTKKQMAEQEGVSERTIYDYIKEIDEDLVKQAQQEAKELKRIQKQERLLGYIRGNLTQEQMAEQEGVSEKTIQKHIKQIDEDLVKQAQQEAKEFELIKKQERLLGYIRGNLTQGQMAEQEGVSETTIQRHIKEIDENLVKQAQQDAKEFELIKRQKRILGYIRGRLTKQQMAEQEGVERLMIYRYIKQMDEDLVNKAKVYDDDLWKKEEQIQEDKFQKLMRESEERWQNLMQKYEARRKIDESFTKDEANPRVSLQKNTNSNNPNKLVQIIEKKIKLKEITSSDIQAYKKMIDIKYDKVTFEEVDLLIRVYVTANQLEEAIRFLNSIIYNKDMVYLGLERLDKLKTSIEQMKKNEYVCELIKNGNKSTSEISKIVRFKGDRYYKNKKGNGKKYGYRNLDK